MQRQSEGLWGPLALPGPILLLLALAAGAEPGDAARGERVFQRCYACHSVDPHEAARLQGPSLYRIIGRQAAAIPGFEYSDAMRRKGADGLVWDAATLERYLADPEALVPGTDMSIPPMRDEVERADLLAYLARSGAYRP
jgi:cytochrome c